MEIRFHANMCDTSTRHVATAMHAPFRSLGEFLSGDYGGTMEHLWIDLELIESHARPDGRCRHPFRLQKRVSGRSHFGFDLRARIHAATASALTSRSSHRYLTNIFCPMSFQ